LEFLLRVSYLEIYNEQINDLLSPNTQRMNGSNLDKVTEEVCINIDQIISLVRMGDINRSIGTTKNLDRTSRAHIIFRIIVETYCPEASQ
jgi:centromeric protein E